MLPVLSLVVVVSALTVIDAPTASPRIDGEAKIAAQAFQSAVQAGDDKAIWRLIADADEPEKTEARRLLVHVAQAVARGQWGGEVLEAWVLHDTAVAVTIEARKSNKSTIDLDPIFMVRQDGAWKVLPKISRFKKGVTKLSDTQFKNLTQLDTFFESRKEALTKKLREMQ